MSTWTESQDRINRELLETAGLIRTAGTNYVGTEDVVAGNVAGQGAELPL